MKNNLYEEGHFYSVITKPKSGRNLGKVIGGSKKKSNQRCNPLRKRACNLRIEEPRRTKPWGTGP